MIKDKILSMRPYILQSLVDNIEGMPVDINKFVKLNINKIIPLLNIHREKLYLSDLSSLKKYINEKNVDPSYYYSNRNPIHPDIQEEYSNIMEIISNKKIITAENAKNVISLQYILDSESYSFEKIRELEECIADINHFEDVSSFSIINKNIIPYKLNVLSVYQNISTLYGNNDMSIRDAENNSYDVIRCIQEAIIHILNSFENDFNQPSFVDVHDLIVLLALYYKMLGFNKTTYDNKLLKRFTSQLIDNDIKNEITEEISNIMQSDYNILDLTDKLSDKSNAIIMNEIHGKPKMMSYSDDIGYSVFFKDYPFIYSDENIKKLEEIFIRNLNDDSIISNYINLDRPLNEKLSFDLDENRIGHIMDICSNDNNLHFGVCCNKFNGDIRYLLIYNDNLYLLLNDVYDPYITYGLKIGVDDSDDNFIQISIDKKFIYSYKYTIDSSLPNNF